MAQLTAFANANDCEMGRNDSTWSGCRNSLGASFAWNANADATVDTSFNGTTTYSIKRYLAEFDTTTLPANAIISAVELHVRGSWQNGGVLHYVVGHTATAPYTGGNQYGAVQNTKFSNAFSLTRDVWATVILNAAGISAVVKGGLTKLAIRTDKDIDNITPTTATYNSAFNTGDFISPDNRPYLIITYELPVMIGVNETGGGNESLSLLNTLPLSEFVGNFGNGYLYRRKLTIDNTKVIGPSDLTNFPVLVSLIDNNLKSIFNGGNVQNGTNLDIRFEVAGGTKTVRPVSNGNDLGWRAEGGDYTRVDESGPHDGDTTRLYTPTPNEIANFGVGASDVPSGATINSVTIYAVVKSVDPVPSTFQINVVANGVKYFSPTFDSAGNQTYLTYSYKWNLNPNTGLPWTLTDVNTMQIGVKKINSAAQALTQIYAVIDYNTSKLDHEIDKYDPVTGEVNAWVRIPTLYTSTDTEFYMYYGKLGFIPSEENKTGVWDSSKYAAVYHASGAANSLESDSTINNYQLNNTGAVGSSTAGKINKAREITSNANNYLSKSDSSNLDGIQKLTLQAWVRDTANDSNPRGIISKRTSATAQYSYGLFLFASRNIHFDLGNNAGNNYDTRSNSLVALTVNQWTMVHATFDGTLASASRKNIYVNGVSSINSGLANITAVNNSNSNLYIGILNDAASFPWVGQLDEIRILKDALSADWVATEYNNQNAPSNFMWVGNEESSGGGIETIAVTVFSSLADTSNSTDGVNNVNLLNLSENGVGADILSLIRIIAVNESLFGADTISLFAFLLLTEISSAGDIVNTNNTLSLSDSGNSNDVVTEQTITALNDTSSSAETLSTESSAQINDASSSTDTLDASSDVNLNESSSLSDTTDIVSSIPVADVVASSEYTDILAGSSIIEAGSGNDDQIVLGFLSIEEAVISSDTSNSENIITTLDKGVTEDSSSNEDINLLGSVLINDIVVMNEDLVRDVSAVLSESSGSGENIEVANDFDIQDILDSIDAIETVSSTDLQDTITMNDSVQNDSNLSVSENATTSEIVENSTSLLVDDTASLGESINTATSQSIEDTAVLSEIIDKSVEVSIDEIAQPDEEINIANDFIVNENGTISEIIDNSATLSLPDSGINTETIDNLNTSALQDSSSVIDASQILVQADIHDNVSPNEVISMENALEVSEISVLTDNVIQGLTLDVSDSSSHSDSVELSNSLLVEDIGNDNEEVATHTELTLSDLSQELESVDLHNGITVSDVGNSDETVLSSLTIPIDDNISAAEAINIINNLSLIDIGIIVEALTTLNTLEAADVVQGGESIEVGNRLGVMDNSLSNDTVLTANSLILNEQGTIIESVELFTHVVVAEVGGIIELINQIIKTDINDVSIGEDTLFQGTYILLSEISTISEAIQNSADILVSESAAGYETIDYYITFSLTDVGLVVELVHRGETLLRKVLIIT